VGVGYVHDGNGNKGRGAARYVPRIQTAGMYEVALSYPSEPNRATNVPVRIRHADGETVVKVNQRERPLTPPFQSLGRFRFAPGQEAWAEIGNSDTDGYVIADAVRWTYASP
jgi:hypothetical protein